MNKVTIAGRSDLDPSAPAHALVEGVDLVAVRWPDEERVSVLYERCAHCGALHGLAKVGIQFGAAGHGLSGLASLSYQQLPVGIATRQPHLRRRLQAA